MILVDMYSFLVSHVYVCIHVVVVVLVYMHMSHVYEYVLLAAFVITYADVDCYRPRKSSPFKDLIHMYVKL